MDKTREVDVIDTVFLPKASRGKGYVTQFFVNYLRNNDANDLAFSHPLSNKMLKLLMKLLMKNPEIRDRIWILNPDSVEKQILWWSAGKIARERNMNLKQLLNS